ncbi:MAG: hypothetical protein JST75_22515 [Bacteroidetes bacterium]|nr:hypothetical protein [Bacteroidota bacterium]
MTEFIGHLHPVLVHLPIGILLLASLFLWQSRKDKSEHLQPIINVILLLGMISAILTCITGYVLSTTGEYDEQMVGLHQWMGIAVAIVSILTYIFFKKNILYRWQGLVSAILLLLLIVTGHLGGSLTHGSDYLTQPLENLTGDSQAVVKRKPILNVQEAVVYADIVQPIFQEKCYGCHGSSKQKGKLRLDQPDLIMKGGKDGAVIVAGKSKESELIKRITLPREEEHHMAPKEKPQLSTLEIAFLTWWIDNGADFTKKVKDFPQPEKLKPYFVALQKEENEQKELSGIPETPVEKASDPAVDALKKLGVVVIPLSQNTNYLKANFSVSLKNNDSAIALLLPLKKQLVSLKLTGFPVNDSSLSIIVQCTNITKLELDHTRVTDNGMSKLLALDKLISLNLVGTKVTAEGVMKLKGMKNLHNIYLYQSSVDKKDWPTLVKNFPKTIIDSGGYSVPLFNTDTVIIKPPKEKK